MLILFFKKLRKFITNKAVLYAILLTGPASLLAIGWFLTEMGRQPWIEDTCVCLKLLPKQAVFILFGILYFVLMVTTVCVSIETNLHIKM